MRSPLRRPAADPPPACSCFCSCRPPGAAPTRTPSPAVAGRRSRAAATRFRLPAGGKLAGDDAVTYTYKLDQQGVRRRSRQVAAIHGDRLYTVSMTSSATGFAEAEKSLEGILSSWAWR